MRTLRFRAAAGALAMLLASMSAIAVEPLRIVVGYQPYDTISYSAVVIRALGLWRKYLPPGTMVEFQDAMQGPIIVKRLQAGTEQIGYLGDMPAVVVSAQRDIAKVNLVASTGYSQGQRCGIVMVRADAPEFKTPQEAMTWLSGKRIATPRGTCADRFLRTLISKRIVEPAEVRHHSLEVLAAKLHAREIDGAVLWDSTATRLGSVVGEGVGRIVATGYSFGMRDAGALVMREDFMRQHPEAAVGWLKAELEAQRYLLDPHNQLAVAEFVHKQTFGVTQRMAWFSLYGAIPPERGGGPIRDEKRFVFDDELRAFFERTYVHLHAAGAIPSSKPAEGAIDDAIARRVAAEAGVRLPLGAIKAQPLESMPK
jgi:NitT/TauT family transport system substrate-binding protein